MKHISCTKQTQCASQWSKKQWYLFQNKLVILTKSFTGDVINPGFNFSVNSIWVELSLAVNQKVNVTTVTGEGGRKTFF